MERMSLIRTLASNVKGLETNSLHRRVERRESCDHGEKDSQGRRQGLANNGPDEQTVTDYGQDYTFQPHEGCDPPAPVYNAKGRLISLRQAV